MRSGGFLIGAAVTVALSVGLAAGGSVAVAAAPAGPGGASGSWAVSVYGEIDPVTPDGYTFVRRGASNIYDVTNEYGFSAVASIPPSGGSVILDFSVAGSKTSDHFKETLTFKFPATGDATFSGTYVQNVYGGGTGYHGKITGVRTTAPTHASLSVTLSVAPVKAVIDGEVVATVNVSAGGQDVTGIDLGKGLTSSTDAVVVAQVPAGLSGFDLAAHTSRAFRFKLKGARAGTSLVSASASGQTASGPVHGSGKTSLEVTPFRYAFQMTGLKRNAKNGPLPDPLSADKLVTGDELTYTLSDWNPDGGPIAVSWDNRQITSLPPGRDGRADGTFTIKELDWPIRGGASDPKECQGALVAKQGKIQRSLDLQSLVQGEIVYNKNTSYSLKAGQFYCEGETPPTISGGVLVYSSPGALEEGKHVDTLPDFKPGTARGNYAGFGLIIDNVERDIHLDFVQAYYKRLICVRLAGPNWLHISSPTPTSLDASVSTSKCPLVTQPPNPLLATLDNKGTGALVLNAPVNVGMTLDTNYYASHSIEFKGVLNVDSGFLYVDGNLTLDNGLSSPNGGSLVAMGNLVIRGPIHDVYSDRGANNNGYIHNGQTIWANGNTILYGAGSLLTD